MVFDIRLVCTRLYSSLKCYSTTSDNIVNRFVLGLEFRRNLCHSLAENTDQCKIMTQRVLNVAEKNDAAKRIAALLAGGANNVRKREGQSVYNKLYEFNYNLSGRACTMVMTSVSGHLLTYDFLGHARQWHSTDPVNLFHEQVTKTCPENFKKIKVTLEQQAAHASVLIIWTDCDREGENIGFEIIGVCKASNPRLKVYRAKFSELTNTAVTRAINNLAEPDERISHAVDVRSELDLRIGAAFTRFQTMRLQRRFAQLDNNVISYGSCQFPTLGFVVERYKAIQEFVPEAFWKIEVSHQRDGCSIDFNWARVRLFNQLACQILYEKILDNPLATVTKVNSKPKSKWRPVALDTVEFEKLASRKLRINAKTAMQIAEKLYTAGIISYPRTETNIFPKGLDLLPLIQMQQPHNGWGAFAARLATQGPNPRNGKKSDQAHPPIHPTKYAPELTGNEARIYELIVRHFLACCSKDALGQETTVEIEIAEEKFIGHGLTILERNYLEVYPYDKWAEKELPHFTVGQQFNPSNIEMTESQTSPPNLLTEADLIALMEKHGIGTDATHAEHIEKIKSRSYVGVQDDGRFVPGYLGMGLVEGYDSMGFEMSKPHLRAELEADLKRICDGERNPDDVLNEQIQKYRAVFIEAARNAEKIDDAIGKFLPAGGPPHPPGDGPPRQNNPPAQRSQYVQNNNNYQQQHRQPAARGARGNSRETLGQSGRGGPGSRAPRRCGVCHEEGHTRRNCPLNQGDDEDEIFNMP